MTCHDRHNARHHQVVDGKLVVARCGRRVEHHRGDDRVGERHVGAVLETQGRKLLFEAPANVADGELLPAAGVLGRASRHEQLDRFSRAVRPAVWQQHPQGQPDVGPAGPHPERCRNLIDHGGGPQRCLEHDRGGGRGCHDKPLAGPAAVWILWRAAVGHQPQARSGRGQPPGRLFGLEAILDGSGYGIAG
jgi:hypothetical protein